MKFTDRLNMIVEGLGQFAELGMNDITETGDYIKLNNGETQKALVGFKVSELKKNVNIVSIIRFVETQELFKTFSVGLKGGKGKSIQEIIDEYNKIHGQT